jgi:nitroreductase
MDAIECMKTRRSVRSYKKAEIPREIIEDIVDCGRLAASAINIQPWLFVAVTAPDTLTQIAQTTDHGKFIAEASCCIAVFCEKVKYYLEDGSAATQNLLLAARAHGLGSCWVAGDKKPYTDEIRNILKVPENYTLVSLVAIGEPAQIPSPPKKALTEVLHWEQYSR